jgi:hypothetical protein
MVDTEGLLKQQVPRFGVGEWYGNLAVSLAQEEREVLASRALTHAKEPVLCPFRTGTSAGDKTCTKAGGVCSLRLYRSREDGSSDPVDGPPGNLRTVCPYRFEEGAIIKNWIARTFFGQGDVVELTEVPFLRSLDDPHDPASARQEGKHVGRIDQVLVVEDRGEIDWCAVEVQAVYFSGPGFSSEFRRMGEASNGLPFPASIRRPDYRSSGPKRLMPQLQIKVPTLRRWGKKLAVVVDESFFGSLGRMEATEHLSNADIAWFIAGYDVTAPRAALVPSRVVHTTLERAVEGLTAGEPLSKEQFEEQLFIRLNRSRLRQAASSSQDCD